MSTVDWFVVVVAGFFVAEALTRLPHTTILFRSKAGRFFRPDRVADRAPTGHDLGDVVVGAFLPWSAAFVCEPWPVSLGADGLRVHPMHEIPPARPREDVGDTLSWSSLGDVSHERRELILSAERRVPCCSDDAARMLSDLIRELATLAPEARSPRIARALDDAFDEEAVRRQLDGLMRWQGPLGGACTALALAFGAGLPLAFRQFALDGRMAAIAAVIVCVSATMVLGWRAFETVSQRPRGAQLADVAQSLASPAHAMHAFHRLSRDALSRFHPLAVARIACDEAEFEAFARRVLSGLEHASPAMPPNPLAREAVERFVARHGLDRDALLAAPERQGGHVQSYCPRCDQQLLHEAGTCPDCPGVAVRPFPLDASPPG